MSKGYSMPGWRVGFCLGNTRMIRALQRLKSYFDYGIFQPIQIAAAVGLNTNDDLVGTARETYQSRRDTLCNGLARMGWKVPKPKATMFVWAHIPEQFVKMGSVEFAKLLLRDARVAVSPGVGFGYEGEGFVRFALVENNHRIKQALRGMRKVLHGNK
jgi:alanine-synthesizing transaminase